MDKIEIPEPDYKKSKIMKELKHNFLKYRTMLHFIYLNKKYYTITDNEVRTNIHAVKECGKLVHEAAEVGYNLCHWQQVWNRVNMDKIFIYQVKKMFSATDILDFLSNTVPCGTVKCMRQMMQFAECANRYHKELSKSIESADSSEEDKTDFKILDDWIKTLERSSVEDFTIPDDVFWLVQGNSEKSAPDYSVLFEHIVNKKNHALRPYMWATLNEIIFEKDIIFPPYTPTPLLENAILKDIDVMSLRKSRGPSKSPRTRGKKQQTSPNESSITEICEPPIVSPRKRRGRRLGYRKRSQSGDREQLEEEEEEQQQKENNEVVRSVVTRKMKKSNDEVRESEIQEETGSKSSSAVSSHKFLPMNERVPSIYIPIVAGMKLSLNIEIPKSFNQKLGYQMCNVELNRTLANSKDPSIDRDI